MECKEEKYTHALAKSFKDIANKALTEIFEETYSKWKRKYKGKNMNVDAHKYTTEAKDLDIEVIKNLWLVKYGNEPVTLEETQNQDELMWECGNRLYWAGYLEGNKINDTFTLRTTPCKS